MKKLFSILFAIMGPVLLGQNQNVTVNPSTGELKSPNPFYVGATGSIILNQGGTFDGRNGTVLLPSTPSTVSNVVSVPTMTALRGTSVSGLPNGAYITLSGFYAPQDGGGGVFVYNSGSAASDDGGTI